MAIARRTAARYAEAADLAGLGLPVRALASVPPYFGPVTLTGSGTATMTLGGFPAGIYDLRARVSTGGALGSAAVEVSTNGGTSYGSPLAVPSSGVVAVPSTSSSFASGLTLTFSGPLVLADVYAGDAASSVERALDEGSDWLDGYLARRYTLPLTAWDITVRSAAVSRAGCKLLETRGYSPAAGTDEVVRASFEDAQRWAERVARGWISPSVTDSSGADLAEDVAVYSRARRRW